jgi:hypothetical protein
MIAVAITAEPEGDPSVDELAYRWSSTRPWCCTPSLLRLRFTFI